jgi:hypothetical protein
VRSSVSAPPSAFKPSGVDEVSPDTFGAVRIALAKTLPTAIKATRDLDPDNEAVQSACDAADDCIRPLTGSLASLAAARRDFERTDFSKFDEAVDTQAASQLDGAFVRVGGPGMAISAEIAKLTAPTKAEAREKRVAEIETARAPKLASAATAVTEAFAALDHSINRVEAASRRTVAESFSPDDRQLMRDMREELRAMSIGEIYKRLDSLGDELASLRRSGQDTDAIEREMLMVLGAARTQLSEATRGPSVDDRSKATDLLNALRTLQQRNVTPALACLREIRDRLGAIATALYGWDASLGAGLSSSDVQRITKGPAVFDTTQFRADAIKRVIRRQTQIDIPTTWESDALAASGGHSK